MGLQEIIDSVPLAIILVLAILSMIVMIEVGFRGGKYKRGKPDKAQMAQVRAIMGASLGLLAFMLAFSFAVAQQHFESRTNAYLLEVTAIDVAYRGAGLLETDRGNEARRLLRDFVQLRRDTSDAEDRDELEEVIMLVHKSESLHDALWQIADSSMQSPGDSVDDSIFANAVLEMIRAHDERVQHTMFNRISPIIWITLFMMCFLSMRISVAYLMTRFLRRHIAKTGSLSLMIKILAKKSFGNSILIME